MWLYFAVAANLVKCTLNRWTKSSCREHAGVRSKARFETSVLVDILDSRDWLHWDNIILVVLIFSLWAADTGELCSNGMNVPNYVIQSVIDPVFQVLGYSLGDIVLLIWLCGAPGTSAAGQSSTFTIARIVKIQAAS